MLLKMYSRCLVFIVRCSWRFALFSFASTTCCVRQSLHMLTVSVFSALPPSSCPSHKAAPGALALSLSSHGACWGPWYLSPSGWPQSRSGSITLQCPQVCICCYSRQWQAATAGKNASENKTRLLQNELKVWAVKLFLFEQHWSLSRSDWLLIVEPFRWEIHLMELKSLFLFYFFTIDSEKATAATAQKSRWIHEDRNLRRKKSIAITVCSVWCWSLISLWVSVSM